LGVEASDNGLTNNNNRLIYTDKSSGLHFLVDTGADISLIPRKFWRKLSPASIKLFAANEMNN